MQITENTVVVVSGGASGLGGAVVRGFAAAGAKAGIFDLNEDAGQAMAAEVGGGAFAKVDVSDPESVAEGFKTLRAVHGQERVMVNCAGIGPASKTVTRDGPHDPAMYAKVIGVNLIGTFNCASQSAAGMVGGADPPVTADGERGVIVNTASVAAFDGQIGQLAYAASKGGAWSA